MHEQFTDANQREAASAVYEQLSPLEQTICQYMAATEWESGVVLGTILAMGDDEFDATDIQQLVSLGMIEARTFKEFAQQSLAARAEDVAALEVALNNHFVVPSASQQALMQQLDRWRNRIKEDVSELRYRLTSRQLHDELSREMGL